jgi:AraC-like DNA-binding protein
MTYIDVKTIGDVHRFYGCPPPKHPLVTVIDLTKTNPVRPAGEVFHRVAFYAISCKKFTGEIKYGRSHYDFEEGTLMFTSPGQVIASSPDLRVTEGWGLFFHPDLLHGTTLGRNIRDYSFFDYDTNEALHVSEEEKLILGTTIQTIEREYSQSIDKHTQNLLVSNIQLLLDYCTRFYDRQWLTRTKSSHDIVQQFERLLKDCFDGPLIETGLPDVKYFAVRLNLSSHYLSDLLRKHTGKTTQEYIHLRLVEKAKTLLWDTSQSVSGIAYELGFEHPSHFTKLFKAKTGKSPSEYRQSN